MWLILDLSDTYRARLLCWNSGQFFCQVDLSIRYSPTWVMFLLASKHQLRVGRLITYKEKTYDAISPLLWEFPYCKTAFAHWKFKPLLVRRIYYILDCIILDFIQYFARNWPWYSLRGLHIRITWFSLYGICIPLFSLYGIHMPLFPYMVILPIVLGVALLWAAMDSPFSQGPLLWRHNDMTVIVSPDKRGRERDTRQRLDKANARRLQTLNR